MAQKVEAKGGKGGKQWDDGSDYEAITKVLVRGGLEGIQFIQFEYVKAGKTIVGPTHGVSARRGITETFEIEHEAGEYILCVEGYYDESTGVIQSVQFKTNKKTSDLMGEDKGTKFSLGVSGRKLIGFHGFAENSLNSLGAYFIKIPSIKSEIKGGTTTGTGFDDGGDFDGVRKVYVTFDGTAIRHIKFDYDKDGQVVTCERGLTIGTVYEFAVNHPEEYITSVEMTYAYTQTYNCSVLRSLCFKTSKGRISLIGSEVGEKLVLESKGNAIVGFHGRSGHCVDGLGAYYNIPLSSSPPATSFYEDPNAYTKALKVEAKGGKGGGQWDDGSDYEDLTKVHVRSGLEGIQFIQFEYVKAGAKIVGPTHGVSARRGITQTFEINHEAKEYLLSVEGYYDESSGLIQSVQFKTNTKTSDIMGFDEGTKFSLGVSGRKIIGFHGFSGNNLNSLGAYFIKSRSIKSEIQGSTNTGAGFDDGGDFDGVRKVYVTFDDTAIRHIRFDYDYAGKVETRERGHKIGTVYEFEINYPNEYLTYVEMSYAFTEAYKCGVLRSFVFKTSKGRTFSVGTEVGDKFVLESKGSAIVGFHGRSGYCVDGLGAYYNPIPPSPSPSEKLQGQGSDAGDSWDDGSFKNVKKIYVGQGDVGIAAVKFEYENDNSEVVVGTEHGKQTMLGYEEFELDYPSEYITSVEGCEDKVFGAEGGVITMLRFKTNKRTSPPFGLESGPIFVLKKDGHKITGFHGKASSLVHQIGVHVVPY